MEAWPFDSTKRSRSHQAGLPGLNLSTSRHSTSAMSAIPIGAPGWPELAFWTASIDKARMALARSRRVGIWDSDLTSVTADRPRIVPDETLASNAMDKAGCRSRFDDGTRSHERGLFMYNRLARRHDPVHRRGKGPLLPFTDANSTNHGPTSLRQRQRQAARSRNRFESAYGARQCVCTRPRLSGCVGHRRFG